MDIYIDNDGVKSFIPIRLYDSESTLEQAKSIMQNLGKLSVSPENETSKISGPSFPVNEISAYVLQNDKWHYIEHGVFDKARTDNYQYLRGFSYFLMGLGLTMIGIKIYLIANNHSNVVDYTVLILLTLLLLIPFKYLSKALPNVISKSDIIGVKQNKKKHYIIVKSAWGKNLKVHIKNKFIADNFAELLKLSK